MHEATFVSNETKTLLQSLLMMGNDEYRFISDKNDVQVIFSVFRFGEAQKKTLKVTLYGALPHKEIFSAWTSFVKKINGQKLHFELIEQTQTTLWFYVNYDGEKLPFFEIEEFLESANFNKIDYSKARFAYDFATSWKVKLVTIFFIICILFFMSFLCVRILN